MSRKTSDSLHQRRLEEIVREPERIGLDGIDDHIMELPIMHGTRQVGQVDLILYNSGDIYVIEYKCNDTFKGRVKAYHQLMKTKAYIQEMNIHPDYYWYVYGHFGVEQLEGNSFEKVY